MKQQQQRVTFEHFLEKFPEIDLPITLGEDTHHYFSQNNDPLPALMVEQYLLPLEEEPEQRQDEDLEVQP